jgi:hypothetical protein
LHFSEPNLTGQKKDLLRLQLQQHHKYKNTKSKGEENEKVFDYDFADNTDFISRIFCLGVCKRELS